MAVYSQENNGLVAGPIALLVRHLLLTIIKPRIQMGYARLVGGVILVLVLKI